MYYDNILFLKPFIKQFSLIFIFELDFSLFLIKTSSHVAINVYILVLKCQEFRLVYLRRFSAEESTIIYQSGMNEI